MGQTGEKADSSGGEVSEADQKVVISPVERGIDDLSPAFTSFRRAGCPSPPQGGKLVPGGREGRPCEERSCVDNSLSACLCDLCG